MDFEQVRVVLFDAVGTVLRPHPPVDVVYGEAGRRFGSQLTRQEVGRRFRAAFARQEALDTQRADGRTDETRERQRWQAIVAEVFDDVDDASGLLDELWQHFARSSAWQLFDDVAAIWPRLSQAGYRLGLASNFDSRLHSICAGLPPLNAVAHVLVSSELGYRKPHEGFFRAAEEVLNARGHEVLLVGDDLVNDHRGAQRAGWHSILLDRDGRVASVNRRERIRQLDGLAPLLIR